MELIKAIITEGETVTAHIQEAVVSAEAATVRNSDNSYNESVVAGGTLVLPDSNITNSDDSYDVDLPATTDIELPDTNLTNSDGSFDTDIPSVKDYELSDVTHTDSDGSSVVYPSAKPFTCTPSASPDWDTDAENFFNRTDTELSMAWKMAYNRLFLGLKAAGVYSVLDLLYVFASDTQGNGLIPLLSSSFAPTLVNSPTFTVAKGFTGNGVDTYIRTGWTANTNAVNYTLANAGIYIYEQDFVVDNTRLMAAFGANDGGKGEVMLRSTNTRPYGSIGVYAFSSIRSSEYGNSDGKTMSRDSGNVGYKCYDNWLNTSTENIAAAGGLSTIELYLLGVNNGGSLLYPTKNTMSVFMIGDAMTADQVAQVHTHAETFIQTVAAI